jgi:small subunit ribosomal protein S3
MGHKVNPNVFRLGTTTTWPSRWFARDDAYRASLRQDLGIRAFLRKELKDAAVNRIDIERSRGMMTVTVHTAKPGLVIGRAGDGAEGLKKKLLKTFFPAKAKSINLQLNIVEVGRPSLEAALVVQGVITDLERRMPFRRVLKMAIERVKKAGALGVKIAVSGRLNGAEIARREWLAWGKIPLTNLRADIDYSADAARTMAGAIGVKVWIYRGDVFAQDRLNQYQPTTPARRGERDGRGRGPRRDAPVTAPASAEAPAGMPETPAPDKPATT